jgi:glycosyltransferase involved in cell wall biosynthesis
MKIAWLNDYKLNTLQGGAELTSYYWIKEGRQIGLDIVEVDPSDTIPEADFYILNNITKFNPDAIAGLKNYSIITHGIPHAPIEVYRKAKNACFMSPSHLKRNYLLNDNSFYSAPYIDHSKFYKKPNECENQIKLVYIGWLYEHKGIKNILNYGDNLKTKIDFYGRGDEAMIKLIRDRGNNVFNEVPFDQLNEIYNKYDRFVWILARYGSYGRTLVEAMLCGLKLIIDSKNFGLFSYRWDFTSRDNIVENLEENLHSFWAKVID